MTVIKEASGYKDKKPRELNLKLKKKNKTPKYIRPVKWMKTFVTKCPEAKSINVGCILNRSREGGG